MEGPLRNGHFGQGEDRERVDAWTDWTYGRAEAWTRGRVDESFWPLHIHGSRFVTMTKVDTRRVCEA